MVLATLLLNPERRGLNVLAVVAHPDDEVIGCGATLAKFRDSGSDVRVLLPLRRNDPRGIEHWGALVHSFGEACRHLGAVPVFPVEFLDERTAETEISRLHDSISPMIEWADVIFTHWASDVNQVHRAVSRAVEISTRPFRRRKEVYLFEVLTSTEQGFVQSFSPNSYSLLNASQAQRKCEAMAFYQTEMDGARTPDGLRRKLQVRGDEIGVLFAEAFVLARHFI